MAIDYRAGFRSREPAMNAFYEHHKDSIRFGYRCFDRILLNGLIQPFQQPERVVGFFSTYRHLHPVSRDILRGAAEQFQLWVKEQADKWNAPIVEPPRGRRDEFVDPYFRGAGPDQVIVILKAREPARIMTAIGDKKLNRWHLQIADRWIVHYNFYISDQYWGRIFVRMCPYLPFSARVCLNQHHWLANRMREEGIDFQQCSNAFLRCAAPERLQQLADTLTAEDLASCGRKWLARLTPFFTETERKQAGCQHRLFFSQIEFCDNLIFHRRAALDKLGSGSSTPTAPSVNQTRSPSSSVARSQNNTAASCKPRSKTWTCPTQLSAVTIAMASSSNTCVTTSSSVPSRPVTTSPTTV